MSIKENENANSSIIGGAMSLTLSVIILKVLGVLYKIPLSSVLGDEGMGYFNSAYTIYSFFYLLCTAGVPKAVMISVSEKFKDNDNEKINKIIKVAISAFLALGIITSFIFVILASPLSSLIGSPEAYATMICIAPSIIFVSVSGVLRGYLNAKMRLSEIAVSQIIEGVIKLALGLLLALFALRLNFSLPMISAFTILGATLGSFVGLLYLFAVSKVKNMYNNLEQNTDFGEKTHILKRILKISLPITVSSALMSLSGIIDLFSVMRRLEEIGYTAKEATALYGNYTTLAQSMFNLAVAVITPISLAFIPTFTRARAEGDGQGLAVAIKSALEFSSFLCAPIVIGMSVFSFEILAFLFGEAAAEVGAPLLVLLSPGVIFMSYLLVLNSSLESVSRPGLAMLSMIIGALVKYIVSGLLLGNIDFGISGAPIGTVISYGVSLLVSLWLLSHALGYNVPVLSTSILPYLCAAISVLSARLIYDTYSIGNKTLSLFIAILAAALIYLSLSALCGLLSRKKLVKIANFTKFS